MLATPPAGPLALIAFAFVATCASAPAQTNRALTLVTPPRVGRAAKWQMHHPTTAAGNVGWLLFSEPFAAEIPYLPLASSGLSSNGSLRIDALRLLHSEAFQLDGTGIRSWALFVPPDAQLLGFAFDVQTVDLQGSSLQWSDNDLELVVQPNETGFDIELMRIPAGTFQMGASSVATAQAVEYPQHAVTISETFWMSRTEITQGQYTAVMGINPSVYTATAIPNRTQLPVERVSYLDAVAFCQILSAREAAANRLPKGSKYRLPTEAEWEYACRGGTTTDFAVGAGTTNGCSDANYGGCVFRPLPVGSYAPNAFGLCDMHGNVAEWCLDSWDLSANYPSVPTNDPISTTGGFRVVRGGGFLNGPNFCRSSYRWADATTARSPMLGFRIVLVTH